MKFIRELLEAQKQVKTKTATKPSDLGMSDDFFKPKANQSPAKVAAQDARVKNAVARTDTSNMPSINTDGLPAWAIAAAQDDVDVGRPEEQEPSTLPAEVNKSVMAAGENDPDWMTIRQLPGYMQKGIRAVGNVVFSTFTTTPLNSIHILANLQGNGPNEAIEMNAVAGWAKNNAIDSQDLSMHFGEVIPGYAPDAKLYVTKEHTYMVVRDQMGDYIYSWPSSSNVQQDNHRRLR